MPTNNSSSYLSLILLITGSLVVPCLVIFWIRRRVIALIRTHATTRAIATIPHAFFAAALSVVAPLFDLWKRSNWETPNATFSAGICIWCGILTTYVSYAILVAWAKEQDAQEISNLKGSLAEEKKNVALANQSFDLLRYLLAFVKQLIQSKVKRITDLLKQEGFGPGDFFDRLKPREQLVSIGNLTHKFFGQKLEPGKRLRLGVYIPSQDHKTLEVIIEWDGTSNKCFSGKSREFMSIDSPTRTPPLVVQCYHSDPEMLLILPSCERAFEQSQFHYQYPEQRNHLKSIAVFKHAYTHDVESALVISLDSDQENFFKIEDKAAINLFLSEMALRAEYELLCGHLGDKFGAKT